MSIMTVGSYELIKDYVHPKFNKFINYYKDGNRIETPPFPGCGLHNNRNKTRKFIRYEIGEHCWKKKIKPKYKTKIGFLHWTRYMTQTRDRYLFKDKGYLVYNYKLKKYEHMNDTPMHYDFKSMQNFKKEYLFKNALKKFFFYYCRISVKEGLDTKLSDAQLEMDNFNKNLYRRCRLCCCVIKIKAFKEKEDICKL